MAANGLSWVLEAPGGSKDGQPKSLYNETGARRRRAHQKSRKGCANCKHRRVKCDECRPTCGQCHERSWRCDFSGSGSGSRKQSKGSESPPKSAVRPPSSAKCSGSQSPEPVPDNAEGSRAWKHARVLSYLERTKVLCRQPGEPLTYQPQDALELMDHVEDTVEPWIGSAYSQRMGRIHGIALGLQAPYLLHAFLAYSASHLRHLHPDQKKYEVAATMHYTRSLQAYSSQLVYEVENGNATALLCASGLLAKLSFINTPLISAGVAVGDTVPAWIRSMQGVKTVMQTPKLRHDLETGPLSDVVRLYNGTGDGKDATVDLIDTQPEATTARALRDLCDIRLGDCVANPYASAMTRLEKLMAVEPIHDKIDHFLAFIATLEPSFVDLLQHMDARALLILAYWCVPQSRIPQWWTGPSATAECRRICAHLSTDKDPMVQALLQVPANFCGFELHAANQLPTPP